MISANDEQGNSQQNLEIPKVICNCTSDDSKIEQNQLKGEEDEELRRLLLPDVDKLPHAPPPAVEANFTTFFAPGMIKIPILMLPCCVLSLVKEILSLFPHATQYLEKLLFCFCLSDLMKPGHDQYVRRHANGCVHDSLCSLISLILRS